MRGWTAGARGALLCSLLLLATREQAMAQSAQPLPDGLTLTDTTLAPQTWVHGMVERRFVIENPTTQTLPVQITLPASTYSGDGLAGLSQTVLANAGTRTLATLHQPPVRQAGPNSIMVKVARPSAGATQ